MQPNPETPGVVIGNHTAKYTGGNPVITMLTRRFLGRLGELVDRVGAETPGARTLEVGAGEGVVSQMLVGRVGPVVALDLPDAGLREEWRTRPGPAYLHSDAASLPFRDGEFDLVVCIEVLEHLPDPAAGLAELARVSGRHLLLSVPREPWFRASNLLTGRYVRDMGNTPGHLNHWTRRSFERFVGQRGEVRAITTPYPWTLLWATTT